MSTPQDLAELRSGLRALLEHLVADARGALDGECLTEREARHRVLELGQVASVTQGELDQLLRWSMDVALLLAGDLRELLQGIEEGDPPRGAARVRERVDELIDRHLVVLESGARLEEHVRNQLERPEPEPTPGGVLRFRRR